VTHLQGRVVIAGELAGPVQVSRSGFNTLASYHAIVDGQSSSAICSDAENPDLYGLDLQGSIICAPCSVGSTTAGPCWDRVAELGLAPAAMLFAGNVDTTTAGGLILAQIWRDTSVVCVDRLGDSLLQLAEMSSNVRISLDGQVYFTS